MPFKKLHPLFLTPLFLLLFSTCKKDIPQGDFTTSADMLKVYSELGNSVIDAFKRPEGGYILVYSEEINYAYRQNGLAVLNAQGALISNKKLDFGFGGQNPKVVLHGGTVDENGEIYLVGATTNKQLRMDKFTSQTNNEDAFIAKLSKNGEVLWRRGYSDTATGHKGAFDERFGKVMVVDQKIYCFGMTENLQPNITDLVDFDNWMVVFDKSGKALDDRVLPSFYAGGHFTGVRTMRALKLKNNDLIIRQVVPHKFIIGVTPDTTCVVMRYSTATQKLLWVKYYEKNTPEGDLSLMGETQDGSLLGFTSDYAQIVSLDLATGNVKTTKPTGLNLGASSEFDSYNTQDWMVTYAIDNDLYVAGYANKGFSFGQANGGGVVQDNNIRPWLLKLNSNGEVVFSKTYDIPQGKFVVAIENQNQNLQLFGTLKQFGTAHANVMTVTLNKAGETIHY